MEDALLIDSDMKKERQNSLVLVFALYCHQK